MLAKVLMDLAPKILALWKSSDALRMKRAHKPYGQDAQIGSQFGCAGVVGKPVKGLNVANPDIMKD